MEGGSIDALKKNRLIRRSVSRGDYSCETGRSVNFGVFTSGGDSPGSVIFGFKKKLWIVYSNKVY